MKREVVVVVLVLLVYCASGQPSRPQPSENYTSNITLIVKETYKVLEEGVFYVDQQNVKYALLTNKTNYIYDCSKQNSSNVISFDLSSSQCTSYCFGGVQCLPLSVNCTCTKLSVWSNLNLTTYAGQCDAYNGDLWSVNPQKVLVDWPYSYCFNGSTPIYYDIVVGDGSIARAIVNQFIPGVPNSSFFDIPSQCSCKPIPPPK